VSESLLPSEQLEDKIAKALGKSSTDAESSSSSFRIESIFRLRLKHTSSIIGKTYRDMFVKSALQNIIHEKSNFKPLIQVSDNRIGQTAIDLSWTVIARDIKLDNSEIVNIWSLDDANP
jgi:hypothetical protein